MSHTTLSGFEVLDGHVSLPRHGVWHADLVLDDTEGQTLPTAVTLQVGDSLSLVGTVVRGGEWQGRRSVRVVGGAGGLSTELTGRWYAGAPFRLPIRDTLEEAGEKLSTTSSDDVLDVTATPGWSRTGGPACDALHRLVGDAGATWRVLPDGTVWVGTETWPNASPIDDNVITADAPTSGRLSFATERPTLLPGQTLNGRRVSYVELAITSDRIRVEAWIEVDGATVTDRIKRGLRAIIDSVVGPRLDYLAAYPARVVNQLADGRVECVTDDARIGSIGPMPIRLGIPGASVRVEPGARAYVSFDGGNPKAPFLASFEAGSLKELLLTADTEVSVQAPTIKIGGGNLPAARQGDLVMIGGGLPPLSGPPHGTIALAATGPMVSGAPIPFWIYGPTVPLPLCGQISTGNPSVKE